METTQINEKIPLLRLAFKGLKDEELLEIAERTQLQRYPPEHILCHEGAHEDILYIIADGSVVISKKMPDEGSERVLRVAGRGDLVGEMALIQNAPRAATVRTITECTMLEMKKEDFETILSQSPRMAVDVIRITLDRMRANDHMAIADLQRTNNILRQLDRNKLEFIQVAAHELRTPLTVLNGYVKLLRSFPDISSNPVVTDVINGIIKGSDRIHEVVNLMLDVTRIDTETLKVVPEAVPLMEIIQNLVSDLERAAAERRLIFSIVYGADTPKIFGDPSLIRKALYQLIINAIKYTPDGGRVAITTRACRVDSEVPGVEIIIKDTGIGLDKQHHELIFEKFYQVGSVAIHSSGRTTFKGGGPGLGLAIVRGVTRAHGGKVWVESTGHDEVNFPGSTFFLQLPIMPPALQARSSPQG